MNDQVDIDAPVIYAGYGITAPPQKYDDYANLDVARKGRGDLRRRAGVVPERSARALRGDLTKMENAAAHGAAAVIFLRAARDERARRGRASCASTSSGR